MAYSPALNAQCATLWLDSRHRERLRNSTRTRKRKNGYKNNWIISRSPCALHLHQRLLPLLRYYFFSLEQFSLSLALTLRLGTCITRDFIQRKSDCSWCGAVPSLVSHSIYIFFHLRWLVLVRLCHCGVWLRHTLSSSHTFAIVCNHVPNTLTGPCALPFNTSFFLYFICLLLLPIVDDDDKIIKLCDELHHLQIRVAKISRFSLVFHFVFCVRCEWPCMCVVCVRAPERRCVTKWFDAVAIFTAKPLCRRVHVFTLSAVGRVQWMPFEFAVQFLPFVSSRYSAKRNSIKSTDERLICMPGMASGAWSKRMVCIWEDGDRSIDDQKQMPTQCWVRRGVDTNIRAEAGRVGFVWKTKFDYCKLQGTSISRVHNTFKAVYLLSAVLEALGARSRCRFPVNEQTISISIGARGLYSVDSIER